MSGSAVVEGVPFDGDSVSLRVEWLDSTGRPVRGDRRRRSLDLRVGRTTLRLKRPVAVPRLRVGGEGGPLLAFRLRRFQGVAVDFLAGIYATEVREPLRGPVCTEVRRRPRNGATPARLLWRAPGFLPHITWDGLHVWLYTDARTFELRRLRDGALMLRCRPPPCPSSMTQYWDVCEGVFLCPWKCCLWEPADRYVKHLTKVPGHAATSVSPAGDRLVYQDSATFTFYELFRKDGFQTARRSACPPCREAVIFHATAAGEVVWAQHGVVALSQAGRLAPTVFSTVVISAATWRPVARYTCMYGVNGAGQVRLK